MTVVQYDDPVPLPPSRPGDELATGPGGDVARLRAAAEYAGYIANTDFVPETMRGRPDQIAAAMLAGAEVGLKPMAALRMVAIIRGRPTLTAEAQRGLVTAAGHEIWFEESTTTRCIAAGRRAGNDRVGRITWTLDDAKRAGLAGQHNYRTYPAEMLRARASAALCRAMFADVTLGIPAAEELDDAVTDNGPPPAAAEPPPQAASTRRRKRPASATPATPAAPPLPPTPPVDEQPEPAAVEPPSTDAQRRRIFALMRDVDMPADRAARLAYTARVVGREIESSNALTFREAGLVLDDLAEVAELPAEERPARLAGDERAVLAELERAGAEPVHEGDKSDAGDGDREGESRSPPAYNEFPPGF